MKKKGMNRVIELCAGNGDNFKILSEYAKEIVGVEMIQGNMAKWPLRKINHSTVVREHSTIQDFDFSKHDFEAVVGIWSLCYLGPQEIRLMLQKIYESMKPNGFLLLNEPILSTNPEYLQKDQLHQVTDQQLYVRDLRVYKELFQYTGFEII